MWKTIQGSYCKSENVHLVILATLFTFRSQCSLDRFPKYLVSELDARVLTRTVLLHRDTTSHHDEFQIDNTVRTDDTNPSYPPDLHETVPEFIFPNFKFNKLIFPNLKFNKLFWWWPRSSLWRFSWGHNRTDRWVFVVPLFWCETGL